MTQNILVIGGTGHTGRQIVAELLAKGLEVSILARNTNFVAEQFKETIEVFSGDITRPESVRVAIQGKTGA